jgi:hypothetical protein
MLARLVIRYQVLGASLMLGGVAVVIGCGFGGQSPDEVATSEVSSIIAPSAPATADQGPDADQAHVSEPITVRPTKLEESAADVAASPVAFAGDEASEGTKGVTFDDIKFEMKKDEKFKQRMLTEKITGLFDKNIRIRGYILPSFKQTGLTQFVLVRDNMECCFGPGAALYDCIIVQMVEGNTANFSVRPVTVEGKFSFQKLEDPIDGALRAIYHLEGTSVK